MNEQKNEFVVFKRNMQEVLHRVEILNRRAAKLGVAPIVLDVLGDAAPQEVKNDLGEVVALRERVSVRVSGEAPKFAGWSLAATLEHTGEGNIIRSVPGSNLDLARWHNVPANCDHCKSPRNRVDTHLVVHESGEIKQVGSSCIADFLGHRDPRAILALAELWCSVGELLSGAGDDFFGEGGYEKPRIYSKTFLAYAAREVRANGFISRKAAEMSYPPKVTTAASVMFTMFPPRNLSEKERAQIAAMRPEEQDYAFAEAAREFILDREVKSDFDHNLLVIAKCEVIQFRDAGIAAYLVEAYRRHLEGESRRAVERATRPNVHFGEVGVRYKKQAVRFLGCKTSFDTQYGTSYLYLFDHVESGARLKWFSSVEVDEEADVQFLADFTVGGHDEYEGWKQTNIKRAKLTEVK